MKNMKIQTEEKENKTKVQSYDDPDLISEQNRK